MTGFTTSDYRYRFNGVISTDKTVMQNLEIMTNAAGSWLSYDIHTGKWSVIINKPGTSVASFNDDNIIGSMSISGTGLTDLYNAVRVEFPHLDLQDQTDFIQDEIPDADRNDNEPDNCLVIQYDILNDPVQAELLGLLELRQSRIDKVVQFTTDYSKIGIRAGDVIDITNELYGWENKLFRVMTAGEADGEDGSITISITAMEYDENVYNTDDLYRYLRTNSTGIVTQGSLSAPTTPQLSSFTYEARPRVRMESDVVISSLNSVVTGVEFWATQTSGGEYTLVGIDRPANDKTYINGETAAFDWYSAPSGNVFVKARCVNETTTGPFSNVGSLAFTPVQVPDAISNTTVVTDDNGSILPLLGTAAMLALLNGLINGESGPGTIIGDANLVTGGGTYDGTWMGAKRYVSTTAPSGTFNNGDVWFKV